MSNRSVFYRSSVAALLFSALGLAACGDAGTVDGFLSTDSQSQELVVSGIVSMTGHYLDNTCIDPAQTGALKRTGSVAFTASSSSGPTVVQNDRNCVLVVDSFSMLDSTGTARVATPTAGSFTLSKDAWMASSVQVTYNDGAVQNLFVNAKVTPGDFSTNFAINVSYSSTTVTSQSSGYTPGTYNAPTMKSNGSTPPNYVINTTSLVYLKNSSGTVSSSSGAAQLSGATNPLIDEMVLTGTCPNGVGPIGAIYVPQGTATSFSAASLGLTVGATLPMTKCLILRDSTKGSYQTFQFTFN